MSNVSVGNIHGTATLNANQFVSGANQAVGALKQLEMATAANWWGLRNLGVALSAIPAAAAAGIGASINAYMQWEDAIAGVERTTYRAQAANETAAQAQQRNADTLSNIVAGLEEIASTTPIAATVLAGVAESAGALGVAEEDIVSFTKVVADLDATTDLTANSAATNLARISGLTGVAGQGYDNLASSILEVGRSTAATEQEIVDIANRIAGIASVANLSAAEVIGMAGALRSAGVRSEQGGTAFQKTFADIIQAVANGGENLEIFAKISGKTSQQLQQDFSTNAADAFTDFISGLGQLNESGENVIGVLNSLGITEARQTQTLLLLAQAQSQTVNENLRLSNSLDTSRQAFLDGTAITDIAARRYETLSSQIQILRNEVFLAAQSFGSTFAPVISFVVERLRDFITGISALPAPLKIAVGIILGITVALLGLASAAILIGPRIVLAVAALRQLGSASGSAVSGLGAASVGMGAASRQAQVLAASTGLAASQLAVLQAAAQRQGLTAVATSATTAANGASALGTGAAGAAVGLSGMTLWVSRLGKGLGILGAVLTIGSVLLSVFGSRLRENQNSAQAAVQANSELAQILYANNNVIDKSTAAWIRQSELWPTIQSGVDRYGSSLAEVQSIIQGTANTKAYDQFLKNTNAAYEAGDKGAKEYADSVITLSRTFAETRKEVASIIGPVQDVTDANKKFEESFNTEDEIRELEKLRKKLEDQARSHLDYIDALQTQARAQFELIDAQKRYNEALANAQDPTRVLGELERRLASARRTSAKSQDALAKAETKLANSRADQQETLSDSLEDVIDAQESYADSQQKLKDAEEELAELRKGPELRNIVKATNDLRNAQLRLLHANQDLSDAEWYLNYLREEGASDRDISDAELALEDARQAVADANQEIVESEEELQNARQGASARELADAEEAVSDALRATEQAYEDLIEKEQEVAQIRQDIADDTAYREAELELAEARDNVADATQGVVDAEEALREARDYGISRDLRQAELDLTDAIYATAQANADARIAQLRMNGVYVDAGTEAAILAEELGRLGRLAPTAAQQKRLREYVEILNAAPEAGPQQEADVATFEPPDLAALEAPTLLPPDLDQYTSEFERFAEEVPGALRSIWSEVWSELGPELGKYVLVAIGGGIIAAIFGIPLLVGGAIAGAALLIAELFGDDIVRFMRETVGPAISNFFTRTLPNFFTESIPKAFGSVLTAFSDFFSDTLPTFFREYAPMAFFEVVEFFYNSGSAMLTALSEGVGSAWGTFTGALNDVVDYIFELFRDAGRWLLSSGASIITGLLGGILSGSVSLFYWLMQLPGRLVSYVGDMAANFFNKGLDVIQGILNGIGTAIPYLLGYLGGLPRALYNQTGDIFGWFKNIGINMIAGILEGLYDWGHLIVQVLMDFAEDAWNAILRFFGIRSPSREFEWVGKMLMFGLRDGLEGYSKVATDAAVAVAQEALAAFNDTGIDSAMSDLLNTEAARMNLAVGGGIGSAAAPTAAAGTIINEGDTINLDAITTADPAAIVDEFMWTKLVRT